MITVQFDEEGVNMEPIKITDGDGKSAEIEEKRTLKEDIWHEDREDGYLAAGIEIIVKRIFIPRIHATKNVKLWCETPDGKLYIEATLNQLI